MSTRDERAARRRAEWDAEVVGLGRPKSSLSSSRTLKERLVALIDLSIRAWGANGRSMPPPIPRSQWPGETFEIARRG